jgi:hypothetical protein
MNLNIFQVLAADLNDFESQVRERVALAATAASAGALTRATSGLSFYHSDPLDECTNALGHLADPWSVVRVTAHVSRPVACGFTGPNLDAQGELWDARPSCVAIARLGGGDQTVVFPTPYAATWLPKPGVHELKIMKRAVPNVPSDALVVQCVSVTRKGPAATPWLLDHLGLPDRIEFDLHRVLASMKPVHQAVFMAAVSRPDIEHKLSVGVSDDSAAAQMASTTHLLSQGIRAAMALDTLDLQRDEASLTRLACLISDLGELAASDQVPGSEPGAGSATKHGTPEANTRCAHPLTATFLGALITRFEELEPQDAADLRELLGQETFWPYRVGSKHGPLSDHPVDPVLSRMGCAMGDALSQARVSMALAVPAPVKDGDDGTDLFTHAHPEGEAFPVSSASDAQVSTPSESLDDLDDLEDEGPLTPPPKVDALPEARQPEEGGEGTGDESGDSSPNALAVIAADPLASLDDLRTELDLFNDAGDPPRPSLEWAAGMLDGDGCIAIIKQPFQHRKPIYRLVVSICQNCLQTLEHFRRCVGVDGAIYPVKRKLEHNKQVYNLNYSGPKALLVIRRLRAYLVRKRPEALVAISFCLNGQISRRFGPHGVPAAVEAVRVSHYLKLRALK